MCFEIQEIGVESLSRYAEIPISFKVESVFQAEMINQVLGGFLLIERKVEPYIKDYDSQEDNDGDRPIQMDKKI